MDLKMANMEDIEIEINNGMVEEIRALMLYKAAADEAMSYCMEATKDKHAKKLMLRALNIGAHKTKLPTLRFEKIINFVKDVYRNNEILANKELQELGIDPEIYCQEDPRCPRCKRYLNEDGYCAECGYPFPCRR